MHSKSDNIEIRISDEADEVIKELFDSLENRYKNNFESVEGMEFVFDYVQLLYCECHKISPNPGGTYINSSDWIKNKIAAENSINKKDRKWFQYGVTATLDYEGRKKIRKEQQKLNLL